LIDVWILEYAEAYSADAWSLPLISIRLN
jgi:hypothetical protein